VPASGEVFQWTLEQSYAGQTVENVMHMRARATTLPTRAQIQTSVDNWLSSQKIAQVGAVSYRQVRVKQMTPIAFDEIIILPTVLTGEISAPGHNTTVSVVITKRTGVAGRAHRGRFYLGGFPIGWGTNILEGTSGAAVLGTLADAWLAKFSEAGTDPTFCAGVYSRSIGGGFPFTVAGWQPITRWDPQVVFGNQRRRRLFVGI
jgi:hypothetical protein